MADYQSAFWEGHDRMRGMLQERAWEQEKTARMAEVQQQLKAIDDEMYAFQEQAVNDGSVSPEDWRRVTGKYSLLSQRAMTTISQHTLSSNPKLAEAAKAAGQEFLGRLTNAHAAATSMMNQEAERQDKAMDWGFKDRETTVQERGADTADRGVDVEESRTPIMQQQANAQTTQAGAAVIGAKAEERNAATASYKNLFAEQNAETEALQAKANMKNANANMKRAEMEESQQSDPIVTAQKRFAIIETARSMEAAGLPHNVIDDVLEGTGANTQQLLELGEETDKKFQTAVNRQKSQIERLQRLQDQGKNKKHELKEANDDLADLEDEYSRVEQRRLRAKKLVRSFMVNKSGVGVGKLIKDRFNEIVDQFSDPRVSDMDQAAEDGG